MGEPAFLAEKRTLAIEYLTQHPGFAVRKTLRRMLYYWTGFWSFSAEELREQPYEPFNVLYVGSVTLLMLRGIRRLWRRSRDSALPYLVLAAIFPLTYYITHPLMDYRQPIAPAIVVMAVAGALPWRRSEARELSEEYRAGLPAGAELATEPA
jgi:hypothetical protein